MDDTHRHLDPISSGHEHAPGDVGIAIKSTEHRLLLAKPERAIGKRKVVDPHRGRERGVAEAHKVALRIAECPDPGGVDLFVELDPIGS